MTGTGDAVADRETGRSGRSGRFPAAVVLSTDEAVDLLASAEEAVAALERSGHKALSLELTNATSALIAALFRDFPTVSE